MPKVGQKVTPKPETAVAKTTVAPILSSRKDSPWREEVVKILVKLEDGDSEHRKVNCKVMGSLAVHKQYDYEDRDDHWDVRILHVNRSVARIGSEEDGLKIGEYLWNHCCLALREKTVEDILAKLPPWVKEWARACREAMKWVDPHPYHKEGKVWVAVPEKKEEAPKQIVPIIPRRKPYR
jgi:hypothetical protein